MRSKWRIEYYYEFINYISKADYNKISRLISVDMKFKELYNRSNNKTIVDIGDSVYNYTNNGAIWEDALEFNRILYDNDIYYNKTNFEVNREKLYKADNRSLYGK